MTTSATMITDSISASGVRIMTFELEYPRIVHGELMTHRVFSRNASSSRAIPVSTMNELILDNIAEPIHYGKNQSGMQDAGEHEELIYGRYTPAEWWRFAAECAVNFSNGFASAGYHKQVCNRVTEFAQHMKVVLTTTCIDNWFNLRYHTDADPTIHMLAACMLAAYKDSEPRVLNEGEWHVPYYVDGYWSEHKEGKDLHGATLDDALKISSSCCAQVSYRKTDDTIEKARTVYSRLVESEPAHASPTEHQATPIKECISFNPETWDDGVTHVDKYGNLWSGNFKGWIQHRQLIPNHVCNDYKLDD